MTRQGCPVCLSLRGGTAAAGEVAQVRRAVLYEHPAVAEVAVIGLPHPALGEEVGAAVVLKPGASVAAEELRDHVKAQVAAYKYARRVWMVEELHKGPTGKILKRDISAPDDLAGR